MCADVRQLPGGPFTRDEITVRRWRAFGDARARQASSDAQALNDAVAASRAHLLPWMPWASQPAQTHAQRLEQFTGWEREWREGGDCIYGVFVGDAVAGGCGLHRRLGPSGLEIGYWLHVDFTGRGVMSAAAALLTDAAFSALETELVEIHHDRANAASAGVPRRLGYTLVREVARTPQAPGEEGVECQWRITRDDWVARRERRDWTAPGERT